MRNRRNVRSWIVVQENLHITRKEVIQMKKREGLRSWMYIIFMAVTLMGLNMLLSQVPAQAAVNCATVTSSTRRTPIKMGSLIIRNVTGLRLQMALLFQERAAKAAITVPKSRSRYQGPLRHPGAGNTEQFSGKPAGVCLQTCEPGRAWVKCPRHHSSTSAQPSSITIHTKSGEGDRKPGREQPQSAWNFQARNSKRFRPCDGLYPKDKEFLYINFRNHPISGSY